MGNTLQSSSRSSNASQTEQTSNKNPHIYEEILRLLSLLCSDDQFPLSIIRQKNNVSSDHEIIDSLSSAMKSEEFSILLIKLIWNDRTSIPRNELTKLFNDCCQFDLKQALKENVNLLQPTMLDNECFSALTNSIGTSKSSEIEQEQFYQWVRAQFPTLFYGFETWFRANSTSSTSKKTAQEASASNCSLMKMNNILNPTWVWLFTHNIPILYLSADNSCTTLLDRMSSVLHDRMWNHLYDSHRDGSSLNRFQHHIFGYKAPIIILFEVSDGYLFCLCCDEEFKESPKHFGGIQACLFQLKPVFKILLEGPNIIFMNTKLRGVSTLGLFIGRDLAHTFLNIDGDFFNVKHLNGEGRLAAIDVWGVGGRDSADEQNSMRQWETKQVEKARKVKRTYEEEEAILNMAGITTRHVQEQL
ncbi:unnamed protein product [Rotaria magnacalcarata]|uniref:TLDc domain-containing protein n=1 Tax=Rotaria magnacalcarata TaxID=392030 RepID=A0A816V9B5_9BILA|nr:unnamed protein product [Rotaria magnacalcarata]CAF1546553.1 unnamed protein product [Rotaria magnacalcarata]CAF1923225.1 unnamed protein product [Rotaria magnacalcarata]CAF2124211.1 unnamed protein product [Rotaria magnacalcarata]CAF3768231.1 unnamed protein product [Rotaria magnacalcarata]